MRFSPHSRVWVYQSKRAFTPQEETEISGVLEQFVLQWQAHGHELASGFEIRYNRFIILIVDESVAGATGCSIDKSVKLLQEIDTKYSLNLFDRFNMAFRKGNALIDSSRSDFEQRIAAGEIGENTIVFNNLVKTLGELYSSWEIPYVQSWHMKVFGELSKA